MSNCSSCPPNGREPNPRPMQKGRQGDDAYEAWVKCQPEGADTSCEAWIAAITGPAGPNGADGPAGPAGVSIVSITATVEDYNMLP